MPDIFPNMTQDIDPDRYVFKCPYCFETISHMNVDLRSNTVFKNEGELLRAITDGKYSSKEDIELNMDGELSDQKQEYYLDTFERCKVFIQGTSQKYKDFWNKFASGTTEAVSKSTADPCPKGWERPVLSLNERDHIQSSPITDKDGMVVSAIDVWGEQTLQRVCPYCHNPLPSTYGKYPIKFISVIGTSGSGKTVYLSQFIKTLTNTAAQFGLTSQNLSDATTKYVHDNPVQMGKELPPGTPPGRLLQPLFYNINSQDKYTTFVFYDIAGENCISQVAMQNYSQFIKHSDGIMFIIDPKQLSIFNIGTIDDELNNEPTQILTTIKNAFPAVDQLNIPLAVVISKNDKCRDVLGDCSMIYNPNIGRVYQSIREAQAKPTFNAEEYNEISKFMHEFIETNAPGMYSIMSKYKHYNFFTFSAIGCDTTDNKPDSMPTPYRIHEPFFWILKELGIMSTNAPVYPYISRQEADEKIKKILEETFEKPGIFTHAFVVSQGIRIRNADRDRYEQICRQEYAKVDPALFRGK